MATSPLPSLAPKRGRTCYVTPAFLGVPNKGYKIGSCCLTLAFSGAQKWAKLLRNPCVLGVLKNGFKKSPPWASAKKPRRGSLRAVLKKTNIWVPKDRPDEKWPTSTALMRSGPQVGPVAT